MKNGVICFMFLREVYRAYFIIILLFIGSMMNTSYAVSKSINKTLAYIIHSGFISGYQNRYGDNLKPPTNVYHRMTA